MHGIHARSSFTRVPLDIINNPFLVIRLPSFDVAASIAKRSALLVDVTELWMTHNCETLHDAIASASAPAWRAKAAELFAVRLWFLSRKDCCVRCCPAVGSSDARASPPFLAISPCRLIPRGE
jgi:hypothetical protein